MTGEEDRKYKCCPRKSTSVIICVKCLSLFHKSCLERKSNIEYLSDNEILCCGEELKAANEYYVQGLEKEVKLLRELLACKEETIKEKNNIINGLKATSIENATKFRGESVNYAEVLKTSKPLSKPEVVVIVKPNKEQSSLLTKKEIRRKVDPASFNVSKFYEVRNGAVLIGCENKTDLNNLQSQLKESLGKDYTIKLPELKRPKLKLVNISSDDINMEDSDQTVIDEIKQSNELDSNGLHMKVLKKNNQ